MWGVTGLRLYLEGKRSNYLAIHLQHLSSLPKLFHLDSDDQNFTSESISYDHHRYYEKVQWKHVCTAPVESENVRSVRRNLRLLPSLRSRLQKSPLLTLRVFNAVAIKNPEWDGSCGLTRKSGLISSLISHYLTGVLKTPPKEAEVNINSAVYPPGPIQAPKLLRFVDTTEMTRGPQESPGYWVVSGARLVFAE